MVPARNGLRGRPRGPSAETKIGGPMQPNPQEHSINPACAKCGSPRMWLMRSEEQYPGYISRMFECPVCGQTMTQWAGDSTNQEPPAN
jgi:hypothetical protein